MSIRKELSLLGLAAKAGKVVSGEFATENAVKSGKAFLVLTAEDASNNTRKKFNDMCTYYEAVSYTHLDVYKRQGYLGSLVFKPKMKG